MSREVRFENLREPEVRSYAAADATVLIPIGAIEQHGSHLPIDTDIYMATRISTGCAAAFDDVLVAPPIPWGLSNAHLGLGGTLTLRPGTFLALAEDIVDSLVACGFRRICWINGHNSNKPMLTLFVYEAKRRHGISVASLTYYDFACATFAEVRRSPMGGAGHACEFETSLQMDAQPGRVGDPAGSDHLVEPMTRWDFRDITDMGIASVGYTFAERFPRGVAGAASAATAETGRILFEAALAGVTSFVGEYRALPVPKPYSGDQRR